MRLTILKYSTEGRVTGIRGSVLAVLLILLPAAGFSQTPDGSGPAAVRVRTLMAGTLSGEISIDGHLDEAAWAAAPVATGFIQRLPVEGDPAVHDTEVRILIGPDAIYVGARMIDSEAEFIADQMTRRDTGGQFDFFDISLDPNLDRRTGYWFAVNPSNVQGDGYLFDDNRLDLAWNAVWESEVSRDEGGWTAEMRIPLSQIRYEAADSAQTWGVNFHRQRLYNNEITYFSLESSLQRGRTSQFGLLEGVVVGSASRRLEARPYALSSARRAPSAEGDPFFDGSEIQARTGMEISYGLGAAFTLDATISPDFGQVESDPAVINLGAFETFFEERRPFFVEDAQVFEFRLSGGQNKLFHSRRLGREPQGRAPVGAAFSQIPDAATILGALKVSGRTSGGLSVGAIAALTDRETGQAYFDADGRMENFLAEPRTTYGVLRLQQDFNGGMSQVGAIATMLNRDLPSNGSFAYLTSRAFNGGFDFEHQWGNREWSLTGFFAASHIQGDSTALLRIQQSSNHYFQRPNATRVSVDSTATSMTGAEWRLQLNRQSGEHWTGGIWAAQVTHGFEINDLGISRNAARLDGGFRIGYRETIPGDRFRSYNLTFSTFHNWLHEALDDVWSGGSWGRAHVSGNASLRGGVEFLNYWRLNADIRYGPDKMSRTATRGGPLIRDPATLGGGLSLQTDRRAALSVRTNVKITRGREGTGDQFSTGLRFNIRPSPRVQLEVGPEFTTQTDGKQYVSRTAVLPYVPTFGERYIFADLDRKSLSMVTRLSVTFTPYLSLQLFAQPLLSSVDYVSYKQLEAPETFDFDVFGEGSYAEIAGQAFCLGGRICQSGDRQFIDFDGDGAADYDFRDRDFNQRSLIGNVVLRWEYRPGSTIFLVWQHQQFERADIGDFALGRDVGALFSAPSSDAFIIKVNYWLGL